MVAPDRQRSATSHSIALFRPLYVERVDLGVPGVEAHSVSGTPVDCVKWAIVELGQERPFDLVLSGINEGQNLATDVLYSGTVAAAGEAALQGIPAIALSLAGPPYPFTAAAQAARQLAHHFARLSWSPDTFLNINMPPHGLETAEWVVTELGARKYRDAFERLTDDEGRVMYKYAGEALQETGGDQTDVAALCRGCISITPLRYRFTNFEWLGTLNAELATRPPRKPERPGNK